MNIPNSRECVSLAIDTVLPYRRRLRQHSRQSISKLKKLIGRYGQVRPILIDADRVIIDGHAMWQAMREMGAGEIAAITVAGRSGPEIKALRLALNRLPAEAAWDNKELRAEFEELLNLSFDLELTGFETAEIEQVLDLDVPEADVAEDEAVPPVDTTAVSRLDDIWCIGDHRLGCGTADDRDLVARVTQGMPADVAFTAPHCNALQHRDSDTGEISTEQFTDLLAKALQVLKASCSSRALIYACTEWQRVHDLLSAGIRSALELYNICVWAKTNTGMGSLYRDQHELVCVFKAGSETPTNSVELGRHGRYRSNLWTYRGSNAFGGDLRKVYPTVKPVALIADVLRDVTKRGGIVLDTFLGSGSTLIAAEETGRRCFGVELSPLHVDVAVRRWQALTKCDAINAENGVTFNDQAAHISTEACDVG